MLAFAGCMWPLEYVLMILPFIYLDIKLQLLSEMLLVKYGKFSASKRVKMYSLLWGHTEQDAEE